MANPVATVAFIDGQAWAKSPDGSLRVLSLGDVLNADEVLVTAEGARVELDFGDAQTVAIAGGMDVGMGPDLWEVTVTDPSDAALADASIQEALAILDEGGDLLAELEETAAGGSDSGGGGGNSFIQVGRDNLESGPDQQYDFGDVSFAISSGTLEGEGSINRAPTAEDLLVILDEDTQTSGFIVARDPENDTLSYVITTPPTNGTVTLNSATGEFTYTPDANYFGSDSFVVTVSDPRGGSSSSTVTLDIAPVNDAPVSSDINLTTDEDTPVVGQVVATDVEGDTLTYAISSPATNGVVILDVATGEFTYTPDADYNGSDVFVVTVSDGNGGTTTSTISIGITPVNDAPVTSNQTLTTAEDTPLNGQIVASDVDGDTLAYIVSAPAANGTVVLDAATGEFTYTPNANYSGSDVFVVMVSDGNGGTTTSTISIGITPVNNAPVTSNQTLTTAEDTPIDGQVIATDVDDDILTYVVTTAASNGTVVLDAVTGEFTYTPDANYNGSDSFVVTVSDGNGGTTTSTITIGVTPVNDAPVASNQTLTTAEDTVLVGQIVASDVDGDTLSYSITTGSVNGTVVLDPVTGEFTYTPNADYNGSDSFVVMVSDGNGGTTTSTITIGITPVNDAPVASNQILTTAEDTPLVGQIVASDVDGDTLSYSITTGSVNGTVVLDPTTGAFTYTPDTDYNGSDSFVVTVSDGNGGTTTSTITIGITPVNDAPVASNQTLTTAEDTPLVGQIVASDVDGDTLSYSITTGSVNGTVVLDPTTGAFTYTPDTDYNGSDVFVVTVSDGNGGTTTSTINIGVTPVNDAPVASNQTLTTAEDTPLIGQIVASDADGDALSYSITTESVNGTVVLDPVTGEFTYTPDADYNGSDSFVVTVSDGNGGTTTSTISIGVTPVNDAPVASNQTLTTLEDTPLIGQIVASDVDGDTLSYSITTGSVNGTVVLDPTTGAFTYTPDTDYNGSDVFVVTVSDGNGGTTTSTITIGITPVNDAPVASNQTLTTLEDTPLIGQIVASDVDGDTLSYSITTGSVNGTVVLDPVTGEFTYTPNADYNGSDSFVVTVSDGNGGTTTSTITIGVTPVNDAPVASNQTLTTAEDTPLIGQIVASDADGDALSYSITTESVNGTVVLDPVTGEFTYTPDADYNGSDSFVVTVSDGNGGTTTSTITIGITPVNDAPVASNQTLTTAEDTPLIGQIVASDVDGDTLSYSITTGSVNGTVVLDPTTGAFTYTPDTDYNGSDVFVVTVSDGNGGTTTSTINIGVTPVNDAPVASNQTLTTAEDTPLVGQIVASDVDGDTLSYSITTGSVNGTVVLDPTTGAFTYTPNADYNGSDSFVVTVSDGNGGTTTSTINIGVTPVNDAPVASNQTLTTAEDTVLVGQIVASDVDGDTLSYSITTDVENGTVSLDPTTGAFTYTPDADYNGSDSFVVTVSDGNGGTTTSTITIGVTPVNDAPVASNQTLTTAEDTVLVGQIVASDVDGDALSYSISSDSINGTVVLDPATGVFTYTPNADYNGSDSFVVTVSDGNGGTTTSTINIGVTPVNDAPVASNQTLTTAEDTVLVGQIVASDVDGDALSYSISSDSINGTVVLDPATGVFTYTPNADYNGSDSFVVTVSDGNGGTTTSTINIGVTPVNDAPVASNQTLTTAEDTVLVGQIVASDVDGDALSYSISSDSINGTVVLDPTTGAFTYTPDTDYNGSDSFVVTVSDGNGGTTTSTINIGVTPVADAPTLSVGVEIQTGSTPVASVPGGLGLTREHYQALAGDGLGPSISGVSTAALEAGIANATPTTATVVNVVSLPGIGLGDGYHFTGFVYMQAGQTYELMGSRDDTLLVKIGGETVYSAGFNQWGDINDQVRTGNSAGRAQVFTAQENGYYSLDVMVYNSDGLGNLSLGFSVNGAPMLALNTINFNLYADAAAIIASGGAGDFIPTADGGYYPEGAGESYTYFNLDISAALAAASEVLSIAVADIPVGAVLTDGTHVFTATLDNTLADVSGWDLGNVKLIPETGYTGSFAITVTATSTDGSSTADTTQVINLEVVANDTNNIVGSGVLTGSDAADMLIGLSGDDQLIGGAASDVLIGGQGNDILTGGLGADTFKWTLGDAGTAGTPAEDVISDFNLAQNDVLDLADLLQGEGTDSLNEYLYFTTNGTDTTLHISSQGGFTGGVYSAAASDQTILLQNVNLSGDSADIISQLKAAGNLLTD